MGMMFLFTGVKNFSKIALQRKKITMEKNEFRNIYNPSAIILEEK